MLTVQKIGRSYYLLIPPSIGVKKFKISRKMIKEIGRSLPIPAVIEDADLSIRKGVVVLKKHKKHRVHFIPLSNGAIAVVAIPRDVDVFYRKDENRLGLIHDKKHVKGKIVLLGDIDHPISLRELLMVDKVREK
jgi:hypothetical protein